MVKIYYYLLFILIINYINSNQFEDNNRIKCLNDENILVDDINNNYLIINDVNQKFYISFIPSNIQIFKNPYGNIFKIITSKNANNIICENKRHYEDSFYLGYSWSVCYCKKCGDFKGWLFLPNEEYCELIDNIEEYNQCKKRESFYGIIIGKINNINNIQYSETKEL